MSKVKKERKQTITKKIKESEIPEEYRLPPASYSIKRWSDDPKKQEEYRQRTIDYLKGRIEEFKNALWTPYLAKERDENYKIMRYFQQKLKEYQRYKIPHHKSHNKKPISKRI